MSSEVKRYGPTSSGMVFGQQHLLIGENLDGDFVKYEDYIAIEAENTRIGRMLYERNNELWACESERDAQQRTQAAGVPDGWQVKPTGTGDGFVISSPRVNGVASHTAIFPDDSDPAHKLLWHMFSAAQAQPASQEKCVLGGTGISASIRGAMAEAAQDQAQPEAQRLREALACDRAYRNGLQAGYSFGASGDEEGYQRSMAAYGQEILAASTGQDVK